jgi:transcription elongation GreA/GreB family factor
MMATTRSNQVVEIGTTIEIDREGTCERWKIADVGESDIAEGVIACDAPLARAVLGARRGDTRSFRAGPRHWTINIRSVST